MPRRKGCEQAVTGSSDVESSERTRLHRVWRWIPLAVALAAVLYPLRAYLSPATLPMRGAPALQHLFQGGDLTPFFATFSRVAIESVWQRGVLPFWSPLFNAGSPVLAMPGAAPFGLATWLGAFVRPEAAIKWSMLIYVGLGMAGVCALGNRMRISPPFCAVGALTFGWAPFLLDHFRAGHIGTVSSSALMPWVLLCVWNALTAERNAHRWAIAAGALIAVEIFQGFDSSLLYQAVALLLVLAGSLFGPGRLTYAARVVAVGALVGVMAFALAAFQLLPVISFMRLANRGGGMAHAQGHGGLSLENSLWHYPEVHQAIPGPAYLLLAALGFLFLMARRERRAALWLGLVFGAGFAIAYSRDVYAFLWHVLPGFSYQRIPQRALILSATVGPVLVAAGAEVAWKGGRRLVGRGGSAAAILLVAWLVAEMWGRAPQLPPMSRPDVEIASNRAMQWIRQHNDGSRMHIIESRDRSWGTEHVTVPLGLPVIISYTTAEHQDYTHPARGVRIRTFIDESYARADRVATFWGVLNVRYVLSTRPRSIPGLDLVAEVTPCPLEICQPAKSAGPYVYENRRWLPPAYRVGHAIALIGEPRATFEAALDILGMPEFDPARCVLLQLPAASPLPAVDAAVRVKGGPSALPAWDSPAGREAVRRALALAASAAAPLAGELDRLDSNRLRVRAPGDGWLVVSERLSLFPGWSASVGKSAVPILRANGVVAAFSVPSGALVELRYRPAGFAAGLGLFGLAAALALALEIGLRGRRVGLPGMPSAAWFLRLLR